MQIVENFTYTTSELAKYYASNRCRWEDIYPSEKWAFERIAGDVRRLGRVLDAGCAAGGLYSALRDRFVIDEYWGVDINAQVIDSALAKKDREQAAASHFLCADIMNPCLPIPGEFDVVVSLSCADWNCATEEIIRACWNRVCPGGRLVISLRLTNRESLMRMEDSFQYIYFGDEFVANIEAMEQAPYVVFNVYDAIRTLVSTCGGVNNLAAYGYWGNPSPTARVRYERLCFSVFALSKGDRSPTAPMVELFLPPDVLV